ncbi:TPA: hypothetical protein P0E37_004322 [Vibrio campbellii]|uniref:hypothetical protein n=1 Tax=Vibrio TaxID=662 RepID=UPI00193CA16C|nr:hypothetical protein [Vibrio vulnificus]EGQ7654814.1 hypothetical protein [Vibrio parahaemolyticus]HDM8229825.1 hypothetical protein [Vibrio campbellii]EJG1828816.1 hypothetical protein [Vibrio parahaemolyticus]ELC9531743.1 hypothetical protein [Vibrio parahaemolyticus]MBM4959273.1 hypothetical protein [Vibrio parahaemolyticus]
MDIKQKLKASVDYWLQTIDYDEALIAFTVRIEPYTYQSAVNSGNPIDYLAKNLKRHLRKADIDTKDLWFSLELKKTSNSFNPHIHGGIRIKLGQEKQLSSALQKSLGEARKSNAARKVNITVMYSSDWITYVLKSTKKTDKAIGRTSVFMTNYFRNFLSQTFGKLLY